MDLGNGLGHLTYSTLVHPGDTWEEIWTSLTTFVPQVKARVCPDQPFGVSLRISASTAETLIEDELERRRLSEFLEENDLYVYTVNAFPYGSFKGGPVKQRVYEPDWRSDERVDYTIRVADILAEIAPAWVNPSIQSPGLGFKPRAAGADLSTFARQLLRVVAHLVELRLRTGRAVTLALEPEPWCVLETTDETVDFFTEHLYSGDAARELAAATGIPVSEAYTALRTHLGVVFDPCHQAVEYEDIRSSLLALGEAGVPVLKLQAAAALRVPTVTQESVDALRPYAETIYLTQTLERRDGEVKRYLNLEDAFDAWGEDPTAREWRVHVHVPVFLDDLGAFQTTRADIAEALALHRELPLSAQLEIETYTWDVLPAHLRTGSIVEDVCRELEWVREQINSDVPAGAPK